MNKVPAGRPEAAAAIWNWRSEMPKRALPSPARARLRGVLQALVGMSIGALMLFLWSLTLGWVVLAFANVILLSALVSPTGLFAGIERASLALGNRLGQLLLAAVFYLFFLPFGALFRRGKNDRMRRFYEPDATSYWESPDAVRTISRSRQRMY